MLVRWYRESIYILFTTKSSVSPFYTAVCPLIQLVLTDPDIISHIFTRNTCKYPRSPCFRPLAERVIERSIAWAEGGDHRRMAKFLNGYFTVDAVKGMHETIVECALRVSMTMFSFLISLCSE